MIPKPIAPTVIKQQDSQEGALLYIKLLDYEDVPADVLEKLDANERPVQALIGLRNNLSASLQRQLINAARGILNEMEAAMNGGAGARPGDKAVKA